MENRRKALGHIGSAVLGICTAATGLDALLSSGCAKNASIHTNSNDCHGFLEEGEYVIPDEVFDAYAQAVCAKNPWAGQPLAGYLEKNYLDTAQEQEEFRAKLMANGISRREILSYERIFSKKDIIAVKESVLENKPVLEKVLPHERFHREMAHLPEKELTILHEAYDNLVHREYSPEEAAAEGIKLKETEIQMWNRMSEEAKKSGLGIPLLADNDGGKVCMYSVEDWREFYPYLAQGEFEDRVELVLRSEFPEAYRIFDRIRANSSLN